MPAELFTSINIRKMDLHDGHIHSCQRISYGYARMCVGRRVDDDALICPARLLNPCHQFPLEIGLADIKRHPKLAAELPQGRINIPQRSPTVDRFLTASEEIEIGTMQNQHTQHNRIQRL